MKITKAIWRDERLAGLPWECRYLLVGLMTLADASGRVQWDPAAVKTEICPYDLTLDEFRAAANKLRKARVLRAVEIDGVQFAEIATLRAPAKQRRAMKEPSEPAAPVRRYDGATFWLTTGVTWQAPAELVETLGRTFRAVDIEVELMRAALWTLTNTSRRKTERGMPQFLRNWMQSAHDRARVDTKPQQSSKYAPPLPELGE